MFNLFGYNPPMMTHVDHDTKCGRWDKKDAELVLTSMHLGAVEAERDAQGTSSRCTFEVGFSPRILQ